MNPRRFVLLGGGTLVTIALAGVSGVLAQLSRASFFHPPRWINWFHMAVGSLLLSVFALGSHRLQAQVTLIGATLGLTIGGLGLLLGRSAARRFDQPALADPSDHTVHLIVGAAALWSWLRRGSAK